MHEILSVEGAGLFDGRKVGWRLHHAQQRMIAAWRGAQWADFVFTEIVAAPAVADALERHTQRLGDLAGTITIARQQVKGHALRGFRSHTGQTPQRLLESFDGG
jgi:hypothetical protein